MSAPCIMGNDPGATTGGIAFYFPSHPHLIAAEDTPTVAGNVDAATLATRIEQMRPALAVIEMVGAMPGQGVASTFHFGKSYGTIIGVAAALKIPVHFVAPTKWKRHFGLSKDKELSRARALELWPARAELFAKKKHHGRAEAALLARYGADVVLQLRHPSLLDARRRGAE